jgi:hypothetical protein
MLITNLLRLICISVIVASFFGCTGIAPLLTSEPRFARHSFEFNTDDRKPQIQVLDYEYGSRGPRSRVGKIEPSYRVAVYGSLPVGEYVFVRWRRPDTKDIWVRNVDLKPLLPLDMEDKSVILVFVDSELLIFLADIRIPKPINDPIVGPFNAQSYVTRQLYPTKPNLN